ncbi:Uncharacterised protein [Mycobacterium tuberculosis]|nr:Uncharacterised protein [Mycobacterium tuberculosis]
MRKALQHFGTVPKWIFDYFSSFVYRHEFIFILDLHCLQGNPVLFPPALHQRLDRSAIFPLIVEKACFLSFDDVHDVLQSVFLNRHFSRTFSVKYSLALLKPFQLAYRHIIAQINALWGKHLDQRITNPVQTLFHTK